MFLGTYTPRLDEKGRLILPAKYRDRLAAGLIVTKGQERCLYVYPPEGFESFVAQTAGSLTNSGDRGYRRVLLASASDEAPDKQGRITIPPSLRQYAGLDRDVVVIGAGERLEIWDSVAWAAYLEANEDAFAHRSEEVGTSTN